MKKQKIEKLVFSIALDPDVIAVVEYIAAREDRDRKKQVQAIVRDWAARQLTGRVTTTTNEVAK